MKTNAVKKYFKKAAKIILVALLFYGLSLFLVSRASLDKNLSLVLKNQFVQELEEKGWFDDNDIKCVVSAGFNDSEVISTKDCVNRIVPFNISFIKSFLSLFNVDFYAISFHETFYNRTDIRNQLASFLKKDVNGKTVFILEISCAELFGIVSRCPGTGRGSIKNSNISIY